jgi:NDP-sugar pyrophosphorylase family protein
VSELRLRAVVLAAGHGNRLRPLTEFVPKPLLPVLGEPILERTLRQLARFGCEAAAVNLFHRGNTIREHPPTSSWWSTATASVAGLSNDW